MQNVHSGVSSALRTSIPGSICIPGSVLRGPSINILKRLVKVKGTSWQSFGKWPLYTGFILFALIFALEVGEYQRHLVAQRVAPPGTKVTVTYKELKKFTFVVDTNTRNAVQSIA